jgi:glucokinase
MFTIGVDLGGTNIAVGLVNEKHEIVARLSTPTNAERPYDEIVKDIALTVIKLIEDNNVPMDDIKYIGLGAPGILDNVNGTITDNSNIHWENYPIKERLQKYIDKPIFLGNDANVATWAEYLNGCGKNTENFIMLTLGTGVGGGIIINGKLITGSHSIGAEIGHFIFKSGGNKCGCGNQGCIEAYCSATALIKMALKDLDEHTDSMIAKTEKVSAKTVIESAKAGDQYGVQLFEEYTDNLAQVLASIINFLDPDVIALGGGVANAGDFLLEPVRKKMLNYTVFPSLVQTKILKAEMGNDAGIIGAACLGE